MDFSPAGRVGIEPKVFYRLLIICLGDVIARHGDLASHHANQIDHPPGKTHVVENKSVHEGVKLAVNIRQFLIGGVELDGKTCVVFCSAIPWSSSESVADVGLSDQVQLTAGASEKGAVDGDSSRMVI